MSPRNETQNTQIKAERRTQILDAALKVFALRGFMATKINDIAEEAGLSHGLVYHYFESKEALFILLVRRAIRASGDALTAIDAQPIDPIEKVQQAAKYITGCITAKRSTAYNFLIMTHAAMLKPGPERDQCLEGSDTALRTLVAILKAGQAAGQVAAGDPVDMAVLFFSATMGLAVYSLTVPDFPMPDAELLVNMVKQGVVQ